MIADTQVHYFINELTRSTF